MGVSPQMMGGKSPPVEHPPPTSSPERIKAYPLGPLSEVQISAHDNKAQRPVNRTHCPIKQPPPRVENDAPFSLEWSQRGRFIGGLTLVVFPPLKICSVFEFRIRVPNFFTTAICVPFPRWPPRSENRCFRTVLC